MFLAMALPIVLLVRMLRPVLVIRFGALRSNRIGHFAPEPELYLCERDAGMYGRRTVDILYYGHEVCNQQLGKMWARKLLVSRFARWPDTVNRHIPGGGKNAVPRRAKDGAYDVYGLTMRTPPHLSFSSREEHLGRQALRSMGVTEGTPLICFAARDSAYLKAKFPRCDWHFHDFRNSNIDNYVPAAECLVKRGYFTIRMGAAVAEKLKTTDPRILDYATNGSRSDFLDIYLGAKCRMFICSAEGIGGIPMVFRRPIVFVNWIPLADIWTWSEDYLFVPKKLWLHRENRFMTFREIYDSEVHLFHRSEQYERLGIEAVENNPDEITAAAVEMDERLGGTWQTINEDEELQRRFWSVHKPIYPTFTVKSRIGAQFLRDNRDLLD